MNPLKSLMALALAFGLAAPSLAVNDANFDSKGGGEKKTISTQGGPASEQAKPTEQPKLTSQHGGLWGAVETKLRNEAKAREDVGQRFADYILDPAKKYVKAANLQLEKAALAAGLVKAVQKQAEADPQAVALLYITIGPGGSLPAWAQGQVFKQLSERVPEWRKNFEGGKMQCWSETGAGQSGCTSQGPYPDKGGVDAWTLAIATAAMDQARVAYDTQSLDVKKSIETNAEGVTGVDGRGGKGDGKFVGNATAFNSQELYELGGIVQNLEYDPENHLYRRISMKVYNVRDPATGELHREIGIYDITDPGNYFGQRFPVFKDGRYQQGHNIFALDDRISNGTKYQLNFGYRDGDLQVSFYPAKNEGSVISTSLGELGDKLYQEVKQEGHRVSLPPGCEGNDCRNYVVLGQGGQFGSVVYYPADKDFKLQGRDPAFMADITRVDAYGRTVPITPPFTALGCAGTKGDVALCNTHGDKKPDEFLYLVQGRSGVFEAKTCTELKDMYQEMDGKPLACKFSTPPEPKKEKKEEDKPKKEKETAKKDKEGGDEGGDNPEKKEKNGPDEFSSDCPKDLYIPDSKDVKWKQAKLADFKLFLAQPIGAAAICANGDNRQLININSIPTKIETDKDDGYLVVTSASLGEVKGDADASALTDDNGNIRSDDLGKRSVEIDGASYTILKRVIYFPLEKLKPSAINKTASDQKDSDFIFSIDPGVGPNVANQVIIALKAGDKDGAAKKVVGALKMPEAGKPHYFGTDGERQKLLDFVQSQLPESGDPKLTLTLQGECNDASPTIAHIASNESKARPDLVYDCRTLPARIGTLAELNKAAAK